MVLLQTAFHLSPSLPKGWFLGLLHSLGICTWLNTYKVNHLTGYNSLIQLTTPAGLKMASPCHFSQSLCLPGAITFQKSLFTLSKVSKRKEFLSLRVTKGGSYPTPTLPCAETQVCCNDIILIPHCRGKEQNKLC